MNRRGETPESDARGLSQDVPAGAHGCAPITAELWAIYGVCGGSVGSTTRTRTTATSAWDRCTVRGDSIGLSSLKLNLRNGHRFVNRGGYAGAQYENLIGN